MNQLIPYPLLSVCAEILSQRETHATLDSLFTYAGAPGEPPQGSKKTKALAWLRRTNIDKNVKPLDILGRLIENYMEEMFDYEKTCNDQKIKDRERLVENLTKFGLQYVNGGKLVVSSLGIPSKNLEEFIRDRDLVSIDIEFNRALSNFETNPRESVSAASNILESIFKIYIDSELLDMPAKKDIQNLWKIVKNHLGFDQSAVEDKDLQRILSGLISIVDGIGSLRTHASSAHGAGKKIYNLEPRHVRLAVHSAHTIALFVLESWNKKKQA